MYPHFIEVHTKEDGIALTINIDHIVGFGPNGKKATILTSDNGRWGVRESYEEVKQMIEGSGCLIQMGDPRLDTSHPLTMLDLRGMIGEPVWDNNQHRWLLVECGSLEIMSFLDHTGHGYDARPDDLIKCPLYRMKVNHDGE